MKRFLLYNLLLLITTTAVCQLPAGVPNQQFNGWQKFNGYVSVENGLLVPKRDTNWLPTRAGALTFWQNSSDSSFWSFNGSKWSKIGSGTGTIDFNGNRPITRDFSTITGVTLGTSTTTSTLNELLYPTQLPTATLTGGVLLELMVSGATLPYTLAWSAGRQASTNPIATINVAGVNKTFAQPAAGATVTGSQLVALPRNVNTTYTNLVTTTDSKTASATTTFTFSPKRYFGWVTATTPSDAEIVGASSEFSTSRVKAWQQAAPSSALNLMYAYPASEGDLTDITVNGFPSYAAFEKVQRSVTNASGYSQVYNIYTSTNKFTVTVPTTVSAQ